MTVYSYSQSSFNYYLARNTSRRGARNMVRVLENRFYYLDNFLAVVASVRARYRHLLDGEEQAFVDGFEALPLASRALLVRMVMRKGELFRSSRLRYDEIGCARGAAAPLIAAGWLDGEPAIDIAQLCGLLTKTELAEAFPLLPRSARKAEQLDILRDEYGDAVRRLAGWRIDDQLLRLSIAPLCDRLRLMFFGSLHQDWSEFVL